MIVEWYALKVAALTAFITWFFIAKWNDYKKCKTYEIKAFLKRREK